MAGTLGAQSAQNERRRAMIERVSASNMLARLRRIADGRSKTQPEVDAAMASLVARWHDPMALAKAAYELGLHESVDPQRISAARVALPYLRPQLQAIETTLIDPRDKQRPDELLNQIAALLTLHPELMHVLLHAKQVIDDNESGIQKGIQQDNYLLNQIDGEIIDQPGTAQAEEAES